MIGQFASDILKQSLTIQPRKNLNSQVYSCGREALKDIQDGSRILVGGFGLCGVPENSINILREMKVKKLDVVSNTCGIPDWGLGILLHTRQIDKVTASYVGANPEFQHQYLGGELEVHLTPQGTLAEKIRAGGSGIPAFWTKTGAGTLVEEGGIPVKFKRGILVPEKLSAPQERRTIQKEKVILEESITGDFSIIKAYAADRKGNLYFRGTANNFNGDMAMASQVVIAQVEQIVENGQLAPDQIHVPGIFVNRIFKGQKFTKRIEVLRYTDHGDEIQPANSQAAPQKKGAQRDKVREKIIKRAAKEVQDGMYLNLGIGIPILLPHYVPHGITLNIQSQNGVIGVGDYPMPGMEDPDLINAGKESITLEPGAAVFNSSTSFAIIRGHHLDLTFLGAMQVSRHGDLANWIVPGQMVKGMGGAMDLASACKTVIITMEHTAKGSPQLLEKCNLPLTASGVVSKVITEKAVFELRDHNLILTEIAEECTLEELRGITGFPIDIAAEGLKKF